MRRQCIPTLLLSPALSSTEWRRGSSDGGGPPWRECDRSRIPSGPVSISVAMRESKRVLPGVEDVVHNEIHTQAVLDLGQDERTAPAHVCRISRHHAEIRPDRLRQISFVDHQKIALGQTRPALARDLVSPATSITWIVKSASSRL